MSLYDVTPEGDEEFEPDAATVAFLDQQQAEFEGMVDDFENTYGFKHECKCGEDYAAGRVGEITQCYHNMMQEALANCARFNAELKEMTAIAQALYAELSARETGASDEGVSDESFSGAEERVFGAEDAGPEGSSAGRVSDSAPAEELGSETLGPRNTNDEGKPSDRKLI